MDFGISFILDCLCFVFLGFGVAGVDCRSVSSQCSGYTGLNTWDLGPLALRAFLSTNIISIPLHSL